MSAPTARAYTQLAEKAWDLPHLVGGLCAGDLSFDKVRAVAERATPETDRELREHAQECSVRQLADLGRQCQTPNEALDHERRFLRFNDRYRTATVQLPPEAYAETRACLESRARRIPSTGETPWDHRLCDAFMEVIRGSQPGERNANAGRSTASPFFVVAHVPLATLIDESGSTSELAGELEREGLISCETARRLACDATIAIAVDDDVGHTMYEGRSRRTPTDAQRREVVRRDRHCRFPGCTNVTFTNTHHIVPWKPNGKTDIDNLTLLCLHHHHLVHSGAWTMSGNANDELTFTGPSGRVMASRPSPLWTTVSVRRRHS